ncbi:MAG TPA: epoxide hydrolase, partial [Candidatus Cybelea sp.]|nr:epoxide hydrolase [Candidatus Cybelea sp.]
MRPKPFRIEISDVAIADLKRRLARARWPNEPAEGGWRLGTNLDYLRKLVSHWAEAYDWRQHEARLNALPHRTVEIDGQVIHFIHVQGSGGVPRPLILTHGWPSSFLEFLPVIEPLAHPERFGGDTAEAFDVVVGSLPGYGFSAPPPRPMTARAIARLWHRLMTEVLGYRHFVAQAGDWG